ncbi:MAG: hypothetical protein JRI25_08595, partial [Deltaproteobacteria bacterium]|nr:hypothetical protein [Deltaproteobacteria bacterium]
MAHLTWPSLGVHQLQACAREAGFQVAILYMNALYAAMVDPAVYVALCNAPIHWLLGERLFARAAYGSPPLGYRTEGFLAEVDNHNSGVADPVDPSGTVFEGPNFQYDRDLLFRAEAHAFALADGLAADIAARGHRIVGATTTFDQTSAGIALLQRIKAANPEAITMMGGANCDQEMAEGVRSLTDAVDYVFSGESEAVFVPFL